MSYRLVKGNFAVKGGQPDGDSVRFDPDDEALLKGFPQGDAKIATSGATKGTAQLRLEGIDALELHYPNLADHQNLPAARAERDYLLLTLLGFQTVNYNAQEKVTSTIPAGIRGYILTNGLDNGQNRRPVSFAFKGTTQQADGASIFLTGPKLRTSINAAILAEGHGYALFYNELPPDLRDVLTKITAKARTDGKGVWPSDQTRTGITLTSKADLLPSVFYPKLYRRLKDFFDATGATSLAAFDAWVRAKPDRDDMVYILPANDNGNLHRTYEVQGNKISMLYNGEDLVFRSKGTINVPMTPFPPP